MKFLPAPLLLLAIFPLVVVATRRRVPFMNCPSSKSSSGLAILKPARSRIECSIICLNDPGCLSASYCKSGDGYTCELSEVYLEGGCSGLAAAADCTQTAVVYPCENGGTFLHENRTCRCADGYVGDYCQRRYRDCLETPAAGDVYTIQPFGSDYTFQWKCGPGVTYTKLSEYWSTRNVNFTYTWEQIKQGIIPYAGFFFPGPEVIHQLTTQGAYDLFLVMFILGKPGGYVIYRNFRVDSEAEGYACHWDSFDRKHTASYKSEEYLDGLGALGDSSKSMNGARFGTFDKDINGCASGYFNLPWWYNQLGCTFVRIDPDGMNWPTNRSGTVAMEKVDFAILGLTDPNWHVEDDLVL
ncbi:delta-like protein D [Haliotis rubra]|uniref:delta-like protein D n=1 Tax=Haliotis rubra TaxID=36100 RepID=UPI001EE4F09E|nr:delta-like protein D [Haliotis rubra]